MRFFWFGTVLGVVSFYFSISLFISSAIASGVLLFAILIPMNNVGFCRPLLRSFRAWYCIFLGIIFGVSFGFWDSERTSIHTVPPELEKQSIRVRGVVVSVPEETEFGQRFEFQVSCWFVQVNEEIGTFKRAERCIEAPRLRLQLYTARLLRIKASQEWEFSVRLKRPRGNANPGGFDKERFYYQKRINGVGSVNFDTAPHMFKAGTASVNQLREYYYHLMRRWHDRDSLPEAATLLPALAIGDRSMISDRQWELLAQSGTNHLMAISGLHIGLVAAFAYFIFQIGLGVLVHLNASFSNRIVPANPHLIGMIIGVGIASFYAALAGFAIPTQRALLFLLVFVTAFALRARIRRLDILLGVMFGVVLLDPRSCLSYGYWLSFFAVGVLLLGSNTSYEPKSGWSQRMHIVKQLVRFQLLLSLALLPVTFYLFDVAPWISPVANIVAIPVVGWLVVPMVLLAIVVGAFSFNLGGFLYYCAAHVLDLVMQGIEILNRSMFEVEWIEVSGAFILLVLLVAVWLGFRSLISGTTLGFVCLCMGFSQPVENLLEGEYRVNILDVGQGLAILVQTKNNSVLYDVGGANASGWNMGESVVGPFLDYSGLRQVDTLVISHSDTDHIGGLEALLMRYSFARTFVSELETSRRLGAELCQSAVGWVYDDVKFEFIWPNPVEHRDPMASGNNSSCVLKITSSAGVTLLSGDIEREVEIRLIRKGIDLKADVLLVPHHGSLTSSSYAFVKAVRPQLAIFSAGYLSRFNHPHPEVEGRYRALGIPSLNSGEVGRIEITFRTQRENEIDIWRLSKKHIWTQVPENLSTFSLNGVLK